MIYGIDAPEGHVSFIPEAGAHAGPSPEELHTFIVAPPAVRVPGPITHPVQLYAALRRLSGARVKPLVVASYNIHRGVGLDRRRDLDRIAAVIEEMQPDVVGLQEVIRAAGSPQADQAGVPGAAGSAWSS